MHVPKLPFYTQTEMGIFPITSRIFRVNIYFIRYFKNEKLLHRHKQCKWVLRSFLLARCDLEYSEFTFKDDKIYDLNDKILLE